jgi:hypothetical protein
MKQKMKRKNKMVWFPKSENRTLENGINIKEIIEK